MLEATLRREELIDAFKWGDEERERALMAQLAAQPRQARAMLDEMLASPDAGERRAAVFGLGSSAAIEEARGDHDSASVLEVTAQALGRLKEAGARGSLIRRLQPVIGSFVTLNLHRDQILPALTDEARSGLRTLGAPL